MITTGNIRAPLNPLENDLNARLDGRNPNNAVVAATLSVIEAVQNQTGNNRISIYDLQTALANPETNWGYGPTGSEAYKLALDLAQKYSIPSTPATTPDAGFTTTSPQPVAVAPAPQSEPLPQNTSGGSFSPTTTVPNPVQNFHTLPNGNQIPVATVVQNGTYGGGQLPTFTTYVPAGTQSFVVPGNPNTIRTDRSGATRVDPVNPENPIRPDRGDMPTPIVTTSLVPQSTSITQLQLQANSGDGEQGGAMGGQRRYTTTAATSCRRSTPFISA